jgi:hypothetical protein
MGRFGLMALSTFPAIKPLRVPRPHRRQVVGEQTPVSQQVARRQGLAAARESLPVHLEEWVGVLSARWVEP